MQQHSENIFIKMNIVVTWITFEIVKNTVNDFHLKLKESLFILKMKLCLNIAQELMLL